MKLSNHTIQVLRNFKTINPNIVIDAGNQISTVTESRDIVATATVEENFPQRFGIYDLGEFLSVLDLVSEPHIDFAEQYATIRDASGRVKIRYFFSDPEHLTHPKKLINMPDPEVSFNLDQSTLNTLKRAASAIGCDMLSITGSSRLINLNVLDLNNPTSNSFAVDVEGSAKSPQFQFHLAISHLRMMPGDYKVGISSKRIAMLENTTLERPVIYWLALEKSSKYSDV